MQTREEESRLLSETKDRIEILNVEKELAEERVELLQVVPSVIVINSSLFFVTYKRSTTSSVQQAKLCDKCEFIFCIGFFYNTTN